VNLRADGRPFRVGHKGAAALEPENTLRSLRRGVELGCDLIEFDVLDLHDGTLVLAHSDDLLEVSHGAAVGRVREQTLDSLREVAPELPTFDEALELLGGMAGVGLHVDLKWHGYEDAAAEAIRRHGLVDRSVVSSFHAASLRRLAHIEAGLARGFTYPFDRRGLSRRRALAPVAATALIGLRAALPGRVARMLEQSRAEALMLFHSVVSSAAVERAHGRGAAVFAWTVNDAAGLDRVVAAGVDGVITDDPRIFRHRDYTQ
jgi:glycerophosphoryl diester phosphodiesterase